MLFSFIAGVGGPWRIRRIRALTGDPLPAAADLSCVEGAVPVQSTACAWALSGVVSNMRYTTRAEADGMVQRQEGIGRPGATCAALIPITKSPVWWAMAQDERRAIFEEQSGHIRIGMDYLPGVARRLHHCRDIGGPFDFLTWFEYAPEHEAAFEAMLERLRATAEWRFVTREVDIRLVRG